MLKKPKVIFITGPTASGKTKLAVQLAQVLESEPAPLNCNKISSEIISADSRQVFMGMDIGSGKDLSEYQNIPYHLIDILPAGSKFSAAKFQRLATEAVEKVVAMGKLPILCGGTGHYLKGLLQDYQFETPATDVSKTAELEALPKEQLLARAEMAGVQNLEKLGRDSKRRIAREIEKLELAEQPEAQAPGPKFTETYQVQGFYLSPERELVREKIAQRLAQRFDQGMVGEVEDLISQGVDLEVLKSYGLEYKWIARFLNGECDEKSMKNSLERDIKAFAKRQMTFIRYMVKEGVKMDEIKDFPDLHARVSEFLKS